MKKIEMKKELQISRINSWHSTTRSCLCEGGTEGFCRSNEQTKKLIILGLYCFENYLLLQFIYCIQ